MADRKISELTNITGANLADDDEFALVDTSADETKAITFGEFKTALDTATGFVRITGDTMTGDLSMGDNVKAIFGAGPELQIYSDGTSGIIKDVGDGDIKILADDFYVQNAAGNSTLISVLDTGKVGLGFAGSEKLATTSTGIDISGSITADDITLSDADAPSITLTDTTNTLTTLIQSGNSTAIIGTTTNHDLRIQRNSADIVDVLSTGIDVTGTITADDVSIADSSPTLLFNRTDRATDNKIIRFAHDGEDFQIQLANDAVSSVTPAIAINRTGMTLDSIAFYEDTGTTPKMVWKSADERLGIGTSSPTTKLQSKGGSIATLTDNAGLIANASASFVVDHGNDYGLYTGYIAAAGDAIGIAATRTLGSALPLCLQPFGGNVGIGTSSPSQQLTLANSSSSKIQIKGHSASNGLFFGMDSATAAQIWNAENGLMRFATNDTERMRINNAGAVSLNSSGYVKTNSAQFLTIGDGASSSGAGLDIIRGEPLSGGTGPIIKMYHGPDSGTQVQHVIASVVGDLIISADNQNAHSGTTMDFHIDGSRKFLVNGTGQIVFDNSGSGLKFAGSSSTLDDYEEGTWTPTLGGNTTYSIQSGSYVKVGRIVFAQGVISVNTLGTGSTGTISGLPFAASNSGGGNMGGGIFYFAGLAVNVISPQTYLGNNLTTLLIKSRTAAGTDLNASLAVFGNSARVDFSVTYETAS